MFKYCLIIVFILGCSSSDHIYRIETKSGDIYYSENRPKPIDDDRLYLLKDLDGGSHYLEQDNVYQIIPYTPIK